MQEPVLVGGNTTLWWFAFALIVVVALVAALFWLKGRPRPGQYVFRASRFSKGNFMFPTQVILTPASLLHFKPELFGGREHSIHINHISSVVIDRNLFFSDILIETSGGTSPVRCHGHKKRDAMTMKDLIERFQSEYYRRNPESTGGAGRA